MRERNENERDDVRMALSYDLDDATQLVDVVLSADEIRLDCQEDQGTYLRLLMGLADMIQRERHHRERFRR